MLVFSCCHNPIYILSPYCVVVVVTSPCRCFIPLLLLSSPPYVGIVTPLHGCHHLVVVVAIPCVVVTTCSCYHCPVLLSPLRVVYSTTRGCCQVCGWTQVQGQGRKGGSVLPHPRDHDRHPLLPPSHHLCRERHLVSTLTPPGVGSWNQLCHGQRSFDTSTETLVTGFVTEGLGKQLSGICVCVHVCI